MSRNLVRLKGVSIAIILLCSTLLLPSMFVAPIQAEAVYIGDDLYAHIGLSPYRTYETGGDSVVTPAGRARRDESYIATTGDLTIKETDLAIAGRGMDLAIERVYTAPAIFENNEPYGFESPLIDVGRGWTLNFPWIGNLLHYWDGTCYKIQWSGNVFENHKGAHFKLVKETNGSYTLYSSAGIISLFDSSGKMSTIKDKNGNKLRFMYANGLLTNITDTVGRVAHLSYTNNILTRIWYDGLTVAYSYSNGNLIKVKDVQGRYCYYEYKSYNPWLLTKAKYPAGGYKQYTYSRFSAEGEEVTYHKYKIASEKRYDSNANLANAKIFTYIGNFSSINGSIARIKDGNNIERVRHRFIMNSDGLTESYTILNISAAETYENYEQHYNSSNCRFTGGGYWENETFQAYYYTAGLEWGHAQVGPFEHYPGTSGYKGYETSVNDRGDYINVTTYWSVTSIPILKKTLYVYNSRCEVIQEDVYVGDTDTVSYSIYRRYDNWGNLVYTRNPVGHEEFYSYANTETSGVFVDYDGNPAARFSNLFYSNNVPINTHSALLGKAELQDNTTAIETYQSYDLYGNPIESRVLFGNTTSYIQFSGTFDETGSNSFPIDLTGVNAQGNAMLKITGMAKQEAIPKTETHKNYHKGVDGTGYWKGKYFKAHYFCVWLWPGGRDYDEGYIDVGPFDHYPGTPGYKHYTTSVDSYRHWVTVKTYYNEYVNRYPAGVDYHFNGDGWKTITNNLGSSTKVCTISPLELDAGINNLYFRETSSYKTKFSWELHVPIYTALKDDVRTQFAYDSYGNLISVTDAEGMVTTYEYTPKYEHAYCTKMVSIGDGQNITASSTYYFSRGLVASTTASDGYVTLYEYDDLGRMTRMINPDGSQRTIVYDDANNTVTYYDELDHKVIEYFDGLGRKIKTERYLNDSEVYSVQTFTYNHDDKVLTTTVPHSPGVSNPAVRSAEYDCLGRPVKKTNPDGTFSRMQYDDVDIIVTTIDSNQHKREFKLDWIGRLLWVKEYYNASSYYLTQYAYDEIGHVTKRIDARGYETTYEYDSVFGRTRKIYCDSTYEQVGYNRLGKVIWAVDRNGDNTTFTYDEMNRLKQIIFADLTSRTFAYDNCSRLISTSDIDYSSAYQYDCRGRIVWESHSIKDGGPYPYNVLLTYDAANRLTKMTYPDGLEVSCTYDTLSRVTQIYSGEYVFANFSYNVDGTLNYVSYGNGILTTFAYDCRRRLTEMVTLNPAQANLPMLSLSYTYDNVGNILEIVNSRRAPDGLEITTTENYEYDWLDRLVYADGGFGNISYSYDAMGNRVTKTENDVITTYQYDSCNRLGSFQAGSTNATFAYDNNGNLIIKTVGNETWQYVYDKENKLCEVMKGELLGTYRYDMNSRRVYQLEGAKSTTTVYHGMSPIYEYIIDSGNHTVNRYIYGPAGRIAVNSGDQVFYYHNDHLGSTRLVTNVSAAIVTTMSYKPFGKMYEAYGDEEKFGFNGKEQDSLTGLYYYGSRYYDPELGRFIQADSYHGNPGDSQSQNRYIYCKNNPLRYIDPTGNEGEEASDDEENERAKKLEALLRLLEGGGDSISILELLEELGLLELLGIYDEEIFETFLKFLEELFNELELEKFFKKLGIKFDFDAGTISGKISEKTLKAIYEVGTQFLDVLTIGLKAALYAVRDHPEFCLAGVLEAIFLASVNMAFNGLLWACGKKWAGMAVKTIGKLTVTRGFLVEVFGFCVEDWFFDRTHGLWLWMEDKYTEWMDNIDDDPPNYMETTMWNVLDPI